MALSEESGTGAFMPVTVGLIAPHRLPISAQSSSAAAQYAQNKLKFST
ncbi:MAG: hypothetical protein JSS01_09280 [Proteobacteria bacterium]|nr:hypothetical protein [Pseudomonadota bacterium]